MLMFTRSEIELYENINPDGFTRLAKWLKVEPTTDDVANRIAPIDFELWPKPKYERDW